MSHCVLLFCCVLFFAAHTQPATVDYEDDICTVQASTVLNQLSRCAKDTSAGTAALIDKHLEMHTRELREKVDSLLEQVGQIARDLKKAIRPVNARDCNKLRKTLDTDTAKIFNASDTQFYFDVGNKQNWNAARNVCREKGMVQPTLKNTFKMGKLVAALNERGFNEMGFWLSALDIGQVPGRFLWLDGSQVDAAMWYSKEPNNFGKGKQTCVWLHTKLARLVDEKCDHLLHVLCEVPEALKACF